ncbi:MAG TPA: mechanosensitive ion channel family protein [Bryobacteraceae bacterium]|nr:mechanosensitive ion channel family protein [Bryobacteraceae bacterium]
MHLAAGAGGKIRPLGKFFRGAAGAPGAAVLLALWAYSAVGHAESAATAPPAAPSKSSDPLNRDTPQSAVFSFLEACHARNYARAWRYLDLRKLPAGQRLKEGPELAQELVRILDRDVQFDVASLSREAAGDQDDDLPANRERVDSFNMNGRTLELDLERVTLRSGLSVWLFSSESVALIPQIAQLASDSPIEKFLPQALVRNRLLDTALWRWIALTLLVLVAAAFSRGLSQGLLRLAQIGVGRLIPRMSAGVLETFVGPMRLLLSLAAFRAGMAWIGPSALPRLWIDRVLAVLFVLGVAWLGSGTVDLGLERLRLALATTRHQSFSYSVLPLASRVLKITILLLAIAAVLSDWGYNTTTILAGLGVGGVAVALASQKTIENLFGSVAVISDRPVSVGDFCRFGDRMGMVEDIGLRSTRIRTPDRTLVTVPNGQFSSMVLENFSKRDKMWFHIMLNLRRDTTPEQVRALLEAIARMLADHPKVETGTFPVRFVGVGTYSLDVEVAVYILTRDGDEFLRLQQDLLLWILDAVEAEGTALALPTQASITYSSGNSPNQNGGATARSWFR